MVKFKVAKDGQWWAEGTSLVGYFKATWKDLYDLFGPIPVANWSLDEKCSIDIQLKIDKEVATIYDWKESYAPGHRPNVTYEFHIGGYGIKSVEKLKELFIQLDRKDIAETIRPLGGSNGT